MAVYTRQSSSGIVDGGVIEAVDLNNEFDQIAAAFLAPTFGVGTAGTDIVLTFDGETNDGVITWMEDEDLFKFSDAINVGVNDAGHDVKFFGATSGKYMEWDESADQLDVTGSLDVTGNTTMIGTLTIGVDDAGHDVKFFGDTASAYMLWDTSTDDLVLAGAAGIDLAGDIDVDGTANLDNTDIDGTLAVDGTTISLDATTSLNIDNSNTSNGITIGTATSGVPISIGHTTSETTINDNLTVTGTLTLGSGAELTEAELEFLDGITAGTVAASKAVVVDSNKDAASFRNITLTGELDAGSLDVSGDADIDGTLEADAITVDGTALATYIRDTVGTNMLSSNTESGITVTYDTTNDNIDFAIDAAQTTITSLLATDIKIGEDDQTKIDFETADEIHFYAANVEQVYLGDNIFGPQSDSDVDLGSSSVRWKDAYIDTVTTTGAVTVGGDLTVTGDDIVMGTNTSGAALIADGTNFNPVVISGDISIATNGVAAIGSGVIVAADIASSAIETAKINADAVTGAKIADDAIDSEHYTDGSIDTAHIADNQVTLAKMAGLARGKIIYGDASGDPAALALGSNGYVLTSDGTDIAWAASSVSGLAADNLTVGDAAVTLSTSSGNITIDATANDSDIIFKGTDATADITMLTLDGSDAGTAIFNHDIKIADDGQVGSASAADAMIISSAGIVTFKDDILIKDGGTIGSASDADAIAIASDGVVTMNQIPVFSAGINVSGGSIAGTLSTAAQANVTSLGTLTTLTVDNVITNGTTIGHTNDTDLITLADSLLTIDGDVTITGGTPTLTIGDAGAEDTKIVFDGNAQDFHVGLDDSADDLVIGVGNALGTTTAIAVDENAVVNFANTPTVASAEVKFAGVETIWIPAVAMYPNSTNGCADIEQVELSNGPEIKVLDFDPSSDENAQFAIAMPKSWNEGTVTFQAYFTVTGTNTGTVAWGLSGVALSDNDSINTAFGTNVVATAKAHSGTSNDLNVTAESGAVTIAGTPAVGDQCYFQIMRDVSADNQSGDARLLGIKMFFTTNAANDA